MSLERKMFRSNIRAVLYCPIKTTTTTTTTIIIIIIIIIIMYIYHALINALSAHVRHINLNMIFYTHAEHSSTQITTQSTIRKDK